MEQRKTIGLALLAMPMVFVAMMARAEDMLSSTVIEDHALQNLSGIAQVNQAAGDGNLQFNAVAVALSETGSARALTIVVQHTDSIPDGAPDGAAFQAIARIDDQAFAGAQGLISVNQVSGRYNQQANLIAAALGVDGLVLAEAELSQSRSDSVPPEGFQTAGTRQAQVAEGAFRDAFGVIQVNQVAGAYNTTFNRFLFSRSAGSNP